MISLENDGSGMSNFEIMEKAKDLKLPNFKYYMMDEIPKHCKDEIECGILNLDSSKNDGTHHVCWWKDKKRKYYFDSFGVGVPKKIIQYLGRPIFESTFQIQQFGDSNCSEWCLYVLNRLNKGDDYSDIILDIIDEETY